MDEEVQSSYPVTLVKSNSAAVNLKAIPDSGYRFTGWSGDIDDTINPASLEMSCDKYVIANFEEAPQNWWPVIGGTAGGLLVVGAIISWRLKTRAA